MINIFVVQSAIILSCFSLSIFKRLQVQTRRLQVQTRRSHICFISASTGMYLYIIENQLLT